MGGQSVSRLTLPLKFHSLEALEDLSRRQYLIFSFMVYLFKINNILIFIPNIIQHFLIRLFF